MVFDQLGRAVPISMHGWEEEWCLIFLSAVLKAYGSNENAVKVSRHNDSSRAKFNIAPAEGTALQREEVEI